MPIPEGEKDHPECQYHHLKGAQHKISQQMKQQANCKPPPQGLIMGLLQHAVPQGRSMASLPPPACNATNHSTTHQATTHTPFSHAATYLKLLITVEGSDLQPHVEEQQILEGC